jgi:hypothetical protein
MPLTLMRAAQSLAQTVTASLAVTIYERCCQWLEEKRTVEEVMMSLPISSRYGE